MSRLKLHEVFCEILESRNAYFQPPESVKMRYPCIKYSLSGIDQKHADDRIYNSRDRYEAILIDQNSDSKYHEEILSRFPYCRFERSYTADNLNHKVYTIYY